MILEGGGTDEYARAGCAASLQCHALPPLSTTSPRRCFAMRCKATACRTPPRSRSGDQLFRREQEPKREHRIVVAEDQHV